MSKIEEVKATLEVSDIGFAYRFISGRIRYSKQRNRSNEQRNILNELLRIPLMIVHDRCSFPYVYQIE